MKEPNPLVPQGSFEAQARSKSQVRLAVFTILTIHVVVLGALLIHGAGCKREDKNASSSATNDLASTPPFSASNDVVTPITPAPTTTTAAPVTPFAPGPGNTGVGTPPTNPLPIPTPLTPTPIVTPTPLTGDTGAGPTDYTIVRGDTFSGLATKNGITVKAIQAANPGVDPAKLHPGQKIKLPARSMSATGVGGTGATPMASSESPDVYVVKAGDNLGNIAKNHGVTVKALQRINNLSTTQIRVGQKLKLPPRTLPASKATPSPARAGGTPFGGEAAPPVVPVPVPAPAQ